MLFTQDSINAETQRGIDNELLKNQMGVLNDWLTRGENCKFDFV